MTQQDAPNQGLPLVFMYDGYIYSKEFDGTFHKFNPYDERIPKNVLTLITIAQAREIFATTMFIGSIIVLTNNVNLKV